jgi:N utilization substance protein B
VSDALPGATRWDERHRAREAALRALYQVQVGQVPLADALRLVEQPEDQDGVVLDAPGRAFAARLAAGTWETRDDLDEVVTPHLLNWRLERIAVIDRLVLWLAVREWLSEPGTPPRVVLTEALELAREYSGESAVRFVNGVLDAVYHRLKQEGRIID